PALSGATPYPRLRRRYLPPTSGWGTHPWLYAAVGDAAVPSPNLRLGDSSRAPPRSRLRQCLPPTSSCGTYPWPPASRPSGRLLAGSAPFWRVLQERGGLLHRFPECNPVVVVGHHDVRRCQPGIPTGLGGHARPCVLRGHAPLDEPGQAYVVGAVDDEPW